MIERLSILVYIIFPDYGFVFFESSQRYCLHCTCKKKNDIRALKPNVRTITEFAVKLFCFAFDSSLAERSRMFATGTFVLIESAISFEHNITNFKYGSLVSP